MDILEAIRARRSIRKFTDEDVSDAQLKNILEAAMMAPSAGNAQPWQFIVIRRKEHLAKVSKVHPYVGMAAKAPLAILVCGDLSLEKFNGFWVQDCAAATQNLLLACHGLGLGAVWTGVHPLQERETAFRELLNLPETVVPLALVVVGHPDQRLGASSRYKEDRIHHEGWGLKG